MRKNKTNVRDIICSGTKKRRVAHDARVIVDAENRPDLGRASEIQICHHPKEPLSLGGDEERLQCHINLKTLHQAATGA